MTETDRARLLRDTLSDLADACYTEGSSASWRLCGVCDTEHRPESAYPSDQTHAKGCAVDAAERVLRQVVREAATPAEPPHIVCEHGTAMDVHCCNCHSGFVFDMAHECPPSMDDAIEALRLILAEPFGCPFCDSGTLRNPTKTHTETCGFERARTLLAAALPPAEEPQPKVAK
jgi:hypothetical protein